MDKLCEYIFLIYWVDGQVELNDFKDRNEEKILYIMQISCFLLPKGKLDTSIFTLKFLVMCFIQCYFG